MNAAFIAWQDQRLAEYRDILDKLGVFMDERMERVARDMCRQVWDDAGKIPSKVYWSIK